jgi:hypothetical protein
MAEANDQTKQQQSTDSTNTSGGGKKTPKSEKMAFKNAEN